MLEIEVKFYASNVHWLRDQLKRVSEVSTESVFEINQCYDNKEKCLFGRGSLLRMRKDRKITITFKRNPSMDHQDYKVMEEYEIEISNYDTMNCILAEIGFFPQIRYEKYRETYLLKKVNVCIDTLPFGSFIELEGEKETIRSIADKLGLLWNKRILKNYLYIFDRLKTQYALPFKDVTFENFNQFPLNFSEDMIQFEAGN